MMTADDYLDEAAVRIESLKVRLSVATEGFSEADLNRRTPEHEWSLLGIAWHMRAALSEFWRPMEEAGRLAPPDSGRPLRHSLGGRILIRAAGPKGQAPAPKALVPPDRQLDPGLIQGLAEAVERLQKLAMQWRGKDLMKARLRNPLVPVFRMSLADALEMHIQHMDRHLEQMERTADFLRREEMARTVR